MWELFDPCNGKPIARVPFEWVARLVARMANGLDYARPGDGWL